MSIHDFLISQGALAQSDGGVAWGDIASENAALHAAKPVFAWLNAFSVITVTGADAASFLQGQLSNDVAALNVGQAQWQGYCQPQGRLLATFPLVRESAEGFWLVLPSAIAPSVVKRLSMFVLRAKAKISITDDLAVGGVHAPETLAPRVGATPLSILKIPTAQFEASFSNLKMVATAVSARIWMLAAINARVAVIDAGGQDQFVPQMVDWDRVGVNFKKGCYPGQEIVARAHYRGAVKRKPVRVLGEGAHPAVGALLIRDDQEHGALVAPVQLSETQWVSLACLHQDARAAGEQRFDSLGTVHITLLD